MLEPIKVIIQDFPLFFSEYFYTKLFAITAKAQHKEKMNVHQGNMKSKLFAITGKLNDKVKMKYNATFTIKHAIKAKINNLINITQRTKAYSAFSLDAVVHGLGKIFQRANIDNKVMASKCYLAENGYSIGIPLTLGYWDGAVNENYLKKFDPQELLTLDPQKLKALDGTDANHTLGCMDPYTMEALAIQLVE